VADKLFFTAALCLVQRLNSQELSVGVRIMEKTITFSEDRFENLIQAYRLLYEAVVARKTKEILESLGKMEEKEYGKYQKFQRIQNQ
jgi:hypothetical protein